MLALPSAPAPAPRRQVLVGMALAAAGMVALVGGMTALFLRFRTIAIDNGEKWVPKDVKFTMVGANVMLLTLVPLCIFAQWAVYAAKRGDKAHTGTALGLSGLMALAFINAQAFIYATTNMGVRLGTYSVMFYTLTGVVMALAIVGLALTVVTAFRYLGGRTSDREVVAAHALYWYAFAAVFAVVWFVVYVTK